jgi:LysR family glycine cleavage system transcriptional activator
MALPSPRPDVGLPAVGSIQILMKRLKPLPLNALRVFEAAARHRSFIKAADELCVTPAAISHQVKKLEALLDLQLFERSNRVVQPTEAGARLAASLEHHFYEMRKLVEELAPDAGHVLTVSTLESFAAKWLVPRLHRFEALHPSIRIRIRTSDALVNFEARDADIAVRYGSGGYPGMHVEHLLDATAGPVCAPAYAEKLAKGLGALAEATLLHDETSWHRPGVPDWRQWLVAAGVEDVERRSGPVFASAYLALEAALAGHGLALGTAPLVAADLRAGRLVRPFDVELSNAYSFWIVCRGDSLQQPNVAMFRDWLHAEALGIHQSASPRPHA